MAEMIRDDGRFEIVRRGYDIDQVDRFVLAQADAWRAALQAAEERNGQLESEVGRLRSLEQEIDAVREVSKTLDDERERIAADREQMLADVQAESERQVAERDRLLAAAEGEAADIAEAAKSSVADFERQALSEARQRAEAANRELQERHARLEADFEETKVGLEKAEAKLRAKVDDLNSMRLALVTGLEAIAKGGLGGLAEVEDVLVDAGIGVDDPDPDPGLVEQTVFRIDGASQSADARPIRGRSGHLG